MIEINNLTTISIDKEFLKKIAQKVLERESAIRQPAERKEEANLSIALVGQGRIRELNKRYRGKNRATDVLAFPNKDYNPPTASSFQLSVGPLGEIVICLREVKKNAKRFSSTFEKELARVLIHGILHLLGHDHEEAKKEAKEVEETKASSPPKRASVKLKEENEVLFVFAAARVMEEKQNYYLKLFFK